MGKDIALRRASIAHREAQATITELRTQSQIEQARLDAIATTTEYAMFRAVLMKRFQKELEMLEPTAAEIVAFMANNAALTMAQRVHQFGSGVD